MYRSKKININTHFNSIILLFIKAIIMCSVFPIISCSYEVNLNKHTVYTPPVLFSDYNLADAGLKKCIQDTIQEANITSASQLTTLQCPNNNITSLHGIEVFEQLRTLGLNKNTIHNISPLSTLIHLTNLDLAENQITSVEPLNKLNTLIFVDLRKNPLKNCNELTKRAIKQLTLPKNCMS